jgi:hypothetical protein
MTKSNMTNRKGKRPINPLHRNNLQRAKGPRINFDGTVLHGQNYTGTSASLLNVASLLLPVDCSNATGGAPPQLIRGVSAELSGITTFYNEYKYHKLVLRWLPQLAPGVSGAGTRITAAYFDNAEAVATLMTLNSSSLIPVVKATRNAVSWNAWEQFTYNVPLTNRRKTFDVNTGIAYGSDNVDRSVQGLVVVVFESLNATENLGQFKLTYDLWLRGLVTVSLT